MMPQGRPWSKESDKGLGEETISDRKSLLLLYLRDILGKSLQEPTSIFLQTSVSKHLISA